MANEEFCSICGLAVLTGGLTDGKCSACAQLPPDPGRVASVVVIMPAGRCLIQHVIHGLNWRCVLMGDHLGKHIDHFFREWETADGIVLDRMTAATL